MRRMLFVDDGPRILEGWRRMLRPQRNEWEMALAPGAGPAYFVTSRVRTSVTGRRIDRPSPSPGIDAKWRRPRPRSPRRAASSPIDRVAPYHRITTRRPFLFPSAVDVLIQ